MKLCEAIEALRNAGIDDAVREAREIFLHIGGLEISDLIDRSAESDSPELERAVARRSRREPLQYILGSVGFYNEVYEVSPDCLIPRQDTEILVDYAVKNLPRGAHFIDLCTGSGCIAISTLKNTEMTTATALDISPTALALARKNAKSNQVDGRIDFVESDVTALVPSRKFHAVLSNPPYVTDATYRELEPEIYFEPKIAFVGGADGLDFYNSIVSLYKDSLLPNGFFAFEIGFDQAERLIALANSNGMSCEIIKDYSGNDRVAVLKR